MITVKSTINLANQSVPNVIPVVQGDTGRSILFTLADFTIPTGATARYFVMKPSGLSVYNDATIDENTVLVDLTAQSLAEYGDCPGQVRIMLGQTVVTSFEFILHVEPFRGIDAVESTTETNIFDKAVDDAREAIAEAAEEAEEYISQALDTTLTIPNKAADAKATGDAISASADEVIAQMRAEIANVYPTETAQGNPATFTDGADGIPVKDLKVSIVPHQEGSGDPSPDNVRPITGMTDVEVVRTGKNLYVGSPSFDGYNNISTYQVSTEKYNGHEVIYKSTQWSGAFTPVYLKAGATYTFSAMVKLSSAANVFCYNKNNANIGTVSVGTAWQKVSVTYTPTEDGEDKLRFECGTSGVTIYLSEYQIEVGSTATDYEPYHTPQTVTTDLERTVYGGQPDITTGELVVTQVKAIVTESMMRRNSGTSWWVSLGSAGYPNAKVTGSAYTDGVLSDKFATGTGLQDCIFVNDVGSPRINTSKSYASTAEMIADIGEFTIVYPLATPLTYTLTPQELLSVLGTNHISTDAESVEVVYRADIKLYIEQLTKPSEDDLVANQAIEAGKFFMIGNRLFLSTASIANGATITPGTNATELSLAEALNSLN